MTTPLERLDSNLWVASRPLRLWIGDVGSRMTVVRLPDGTLVLHSPVAIDDATRVAIDALGPVRWIVGPCLVHHLYLADWLAAYPDAELLGAPELAVKRSDLPFAGEIPAATPPEWENVLDLVAVDGAPIMNEVAFLHRPSRTLILTDLAFHRPPGTPDGARLFHWLVGANGRFGPHRIVRLGIRDRTAAARSIDRILAWDFDRVVVSHGVVLESGGRERMREAFAFLR